MNRQPESDVSPTTNEAADRLHETFDRTDKGLHQHKWLDAALMAGLGAASERPEDPDE